MLAADLRAIDGSDNNILHPDWGSTLEQLLRTAPAEYSDDIKSPAGADRISARAISQLVVSQPEDQALNERGMSAFIYVWGQFLDHDIDQTTAATPTESMPVAVPTGDPDFDPSGTGTQTIPLSRSIYDLATGTSAANPRQQINTITAFIDGSQVYGSDAERAAALRTFAGGRLKTSEGNLLPFNTMGLKNDNALGLPADSLFVAGDTRANENIELTAIHTLFMREHNRLADKYAALNPTWTDEQIYQQARRIVIAELQEITYNEFLPALLGQGALPSYRGYNPQVNPGIANEFSTAAFRLGHSLLGEDVEFLDNLGNPVHDEVELRDTFFNPALLEETGIDSIFKYLASDVAQELDVHIVDDVRNFLFGPPGSGGMDLAALNIQRGRDHGLADYNTVRVAYGLRPVTSFAQITTDVPTQQALQAAYGNVNNIDLWVGALAEDHVRGASVGPLLSKILVDQFTRLRDGDRFWYQRDLSASELRDVQSRNLADVVRLNTTTKNLQENVFFFTPSISGSLFIDANANGRQDRRESPMRGVTVQLLDADNNVVATTVTGRDGSYSFKGLDLGTYRVRVSLPSSMVQTTRNPRDITITRDSDFGSIDFGVRLRLRSIALN
jgi:peroxidase